MAPALQSESCAFRSSQNVLGDRERNESFWAVYGLPRALFAIRRGFFGLTTVHSIDARRFAVLRAKLSLKPPEGRAGHSILRCFNSPIQQLVLWKIVLLLCLSSGTANAADLKPETLKAWDDYVAAVDTQMQERMSAAHPFLLADEDPRRAARIRSGEILVFPAGEHIPKQVPSGLIHDWYGQLFIPDVTLLDVRRILRNYGCYKELYKPVVVDSSRMLKNDSQSTG